MVTLVTVVTVAPRKVRLFNAMMYHKILAKKQSFAFFINIGCERDILTGEFFLICTYLAPKADSALNVLYWPVTAHTQNFCR